MDNRIRLVHIASGDLWAGAEVQVFQLAQHLFAQDDTDISVLLLNHGEMSERLVREGIEVHVIDESRRSPPVIAARAARLFARLRPHIVHTHRYKEHTLACMTAHVSGARRVCTVHSADVPQETLRRRLARGLGSFSLRRADAVVCVSPELAPAVGARFPHTPVQVIENGIDAHEVRADGMQAIDESLLGDGLRVAFVGRLVSVKRPDIFMAVAHRLAGKRNFSFHVLGDGPLRAESEAFAARHGLNVRFLGFRRDVRAFLARMDALVLCSDHEGLPMVLLEAMALGVPVIANAVGGIPHVLDWGSCGQLVKEHHADAYAAALLHLEATPTSAYERAGRAYERVHSEYSADRCVHRHMKLYRSLLAQDSMRSKDVCYP